MSIITTITPVFMLTTTIINAGAHQTIVSKQQKATVTMVNTGIVGPRGEQGPLYTGDDLPDFTLIFDNKLI
jgi:hypothetical protein